MALKNQGNEICLIQTGAAPAKLLRRSGRGGGERFPLPLPVKGESEARFVQHC